LEYIRELTDKKYILGKRNRNGQGYILRLCKIATSREVHQACWKAAAARYPILLMKRTKPLKNHNHWMPADYTLRIIKIDKKKSVVCNLA